MTHPVPDLPDVHEAFLASPRKHILMITNHGIHQWRVVPGLPDTGGQNVFVNQFSRALVQLGFKVTIVNRGGYVHPLSDEWQRGLVYKDGHQRILYLQDGRAEFVRKEDMHEQIPGLVESLLRFQNAEATEVDLILSHYWDGAQIGALYNSGRPEGTQHIWIPHSLGRLKRRNVAQDRWGDLRLSERIAVEQQLIPKLDGVAATSPIVRHVLAQDYQYAGPDLFLPPCIDVERYHPRAVEDQDRVWDFLSQRSGLSAADVRCCKIVTEVSRTDTTKRKDVLIRAFAQAHQRVPASLLLVSIDDNQAELAAELKRLIGDLGVQDHVAVVGSVWDLLPTLYAVTDIYCTPSVMEGFGMSAQEAAATGVPVVASHLVPFVVAYLLGGDVEEIAYDGGSSEPLRQGRGALVVQADDVRGFAHALELLLSDESQRKEMGDNAFAATIPYFTWRNMASAFVADIGSTHE